MENLKNTNLFTLEQTIAKDLLEKQEYPWECIKEIKSYIIRKGRTLDKKKYDELKENVWVAKNATIASTAYIEAPTIIDEYAELRHCSYIRGSVIIGREAVVGNSVELKNCILFNKVQVPHYNYVGDSILGYASHLGAGSIISNQKADKTDVAIKLPNENIKTNLRKLGAILGDYAEIGCNSVLNPGTIIGRNTTVYPLSSVRGYISENSIYKKKNEIIDKIN